MSRRASSRQLALFDVMPLVRVAPARPPEELAPPQAGQAGDEEVRRAARELRTDLVLRAGAGTGKTHTLVEVAAHLVAGVTPLGRVPAGAILALTFSEKAASELRARVRARFLELAAAPRADRALEEAYRRTGAVVPGADVWRAAATAVSAAPFTTFHGYAAGLVRRHGGDPGFEILDEDEAAALLRERAEEAVLAALDESPDAVSVLIRELDFARGPGARARGLVEHVIAVAERLREEGRGAAALEGQGDDEDGARRALAAAARAHGAALRDLVAALAGKAAAGVQARHTELTALLPSVDAVLAALDGTVDPFAGGPLARVAELHKGSIGNAEARLSARKRLREAEAGILRAHVSLRAAPLARVFADLVHRVLTAYASARRALGVLDFADLVARARVLLQDDPAARATEIARHRVVLVDELQDTNDLQDELVSLVRGPGTPLVCVGDPKQAIYEFRGADVSVFGRVAARVVAGGGRALALTESRRARAPLTGFVNRLFARSMRGGEHAFEVAFEPELDALHAYRGGDGSCVELIDGDDAGREAAHVARHLRALIDSGRPVVHRPGRAGPPASGEVEEARPARWGDVAILMRRFTRLERFLEELRRAGVPHYVVNGRGFYEAQEVRDLVHALVLVDNPEHHVATLTVLRSPLVGLSDPTLVELVAVTGGALRLAPMLEPSFVPPPTILPAQAQRLATFVALFRRLRAHADRLGAAGILRSLVEETDFAAVLATTHHGEQRVANLERLLAVVVEHDAAGRGDRASLVRRLHAQATRPRSFAAPAQIVGEREDVVRVMTVHQAKGLEFPVVYVPECGVPERDPGGEVVHDRHGGIGFRLRVASQPERVASARAEQVDAVRRARARAESLRLFYVAATRARDLLVLSGVASGSAPCWRREVDGLLQVDEGARALVTRVAPLPRTPAPRVEPPAAVPGPPRTLPSVTPSPAGARARLVIAPVTALADLAACPRRYRLRHELGLVELHAPPPGDADAGADALSEPTASYGLDAAGRGTLAHDLLERVDLAAYPRHGAAALDEVLATLPASPEVDVAEVRARVAAFLDSRFGRKLCARAGSVRREVPFAYAVESPTGVRLLLKGQMDLVLFDDAEGVTILDYKLARPPADDREPGAYRVQLLAYAAAARALWNRPARTGLVYLREAVPAPRFYPADDPTAELQELAAALASTRLSEHDDGPAPRPLATCTALHCGYVGRCYPPGA